MKAYSVDLKQKIVDIYQSESISQRQLAQRFGVTKSFVIKLLKQYRETGDIRPLPHGGGAKLKVSPQQLETLGELIETHNDGTDEPKIKFNGQKKLFRQQRRRVKECKN